MTYEEIAEATKDFTKIIEPGQCNILIAHIGGWISHFEESLAEQTDKTTAIWSRLRDTYGSDKRTDRALELTQEYKDQQTIKRQIGILRRLRSDLRDRFLVLTNLKRY